MLGVPERVEACLFDMDGVLTQTAGLHAEAWKQTFDEFLRERAGRQGERLDPFDEHGDYDRYVDGRPRADGVRSFLASRGIELPQGGADDPPGKPTIAGLGERKNELLLERIAREGVQAYDGSVAYVRAARAGGLRCAVVSASVNTARVLEAAGLEGLFDAVIDGRVAADQHLHGKPAPDTYLAGARALGVEPGAGAVYEDALAGVEAGRAGGFALVVGVDRVGQARALREHGADIVVDDLAELIDAQ
ncbi:MAG TPA: beta-phosphoglucomutase family hydrolase [Solirubrobacteraceae bacterium]|nr:beta-phosphoglucomutase family hydrolase [Solirubrobacteraceae bacterium]